ncbi:FHA domain-containing protein [Microbacterium sp. Clip185]|uniref:FHA domain-containing protein n=1 Tax=Microbacterium sp. Clip185 TaxID=3025663 RepID=UPI002366C2A1|nr:FHA domain-containing protein [Microbacterium sp. Clip185]WDG18490.1 FHA domain-containing protein [Microbacterium sp. Clip185]
MDDSSVVLTVMIVAAVVVGIFAAGWHVWYAIGLSRVLQERETEPWRAWVPIMNEAELFRLGNVDPVKAALLLVPFVNVYALILKIMAVHRINSEAGRGAGTTVLGVLLPPVWAAVLSGGRAPAAPQQPAVAPGRPAPVFAVAPPAQRPPAIPDAVVAPPVPPVAPAPMGPGAVPPAAAPSAPAPSGYGPKRRGVTPGVPAAPTAAVPPAAAPSAVPAPAVAPAAAPVMPPAPAAPPTPVAQPQSAPSPAPAQPAPVLRSGAVEPEPAPLTRRARRGAEETPVPTGWSLALPSGEVVAVAAAALVLGRNPRATESGVQYVAVTDEARTVSKEHARLVWDGAAWTITDLGSTNGVSLLDASGAEQAVAAGGSAPVTDRFVLGDAVVQIRRAS